MNEHTSSSMVIPGSNRTFNPYYDEELTLIHRSVSFCLIIFFLFFLIFFSSNKRRMIGIN